MADPLHEALIRKVRNRAPHCPSPDTEIMVAAGIDAALVNSAELETLCAIWLPAWRAYLRSAPFGFAWNVTGDPIEAAHGIKEAK